jgi:hypothetical protein
MPRWADMRISPGRRKDIHEGAKWGERKNKISVKIFIANSLTDGTRKM